MRNNKISRIFLSLTAVLLVLVFSGTALAAGYVQATGGNVYVRNAPNLNGKGLDAMQEGQTATYLDASSTDGRGVVWYKVSFKGKTGWVSSRYSKLYGANVSVPSESSGTVKAVGGNCNIRNAPNLNGNEIGMMKEGQKGTYLGSSSVDERGVTWYKVKFNGKIGWVSSRYTEVY